MFVVFPQCATLQLKRPLMLNPLAVPTWRVSSVQPLPCGTLCLIDQRDGKRVGQLLAGCGVGLFDGAPLFVPETLDEILQRIAIA